MLVFNNVYEGRNERHELSEHAGMPVIEGVKWAFNLWFREETRKVLYKYPVVNKTNVETNLINDDSTNVDSTNDGFN